MTNLVTTLWIDNFEQFEEKVCLRNLAKQGRFSSAFPLNALVLSGFDLLPATYLDELKEHSVNLQDVTSLTQELVQEYRSDLNFVNNYEFLCFVRWLVISKFFSNSPFVHIDSDLYIQIDSGDFLDLFTGLSGTFGSPCLTACSSPEWLESYRDNFLMFINDPRDFRKQFSNLDISLLRDNIGSDQDLIHLLESAGRLPRLKDNFDLDAWSVFINPLWPYIVKPSSPTRFSRTDDVDFIDNKRVLFWHMQNDFSIYVGRALLIKDSLYSLGQEELWPTRIPLPYLQLDKNTDNIVLKIFEWMLSRGSNNYSDKVYNPFARRYVTDRFICGSECREIFSALTWWEADVFS